MADVQTNKCYRIRLCSGELLDWRYLGEDASGRRWWRDETRSGDGGEKGSAFSESALMYAWEILMEVNETAVPDRAGAAGRLLPVGAECSPAGGVHFRVWAPDHGRVELLLEDASGAIVATHGLRAEGDGHFSGHVAAAAAGTRYRFRLGEGGGAYPDPASRWQPDGPHGASCVIDASRFCWSDRAWPGIPPGNQILYELHLGTFTRAGTVAAATAELDELAALGITIVELMPIADFPGDFGWGYDGVSLFAPCRLYGDPDDYRRFIDRAHALGIAVILDVVYNHFGPDGNYLSAFAKDFFTDKYGNEWGAAINFDGENAHGVREFFVSNAAYWIAEYHFDGFRLDATQQICDASGRHILAEVATAARRAAAGRRTLIFAENEKQEIRHVRAQEDGGYGLDGLWNDDLHHALRVRLTGHSEAYYTDYRGSAQEFVSALKWGYLYQGQRYSWQRQRRGTPTFGVDPSCFVSFLENHDQVANSTRGERLNRLTAPDLLRAASAMVLLAPGTPMLFQGQEFASSAPFVYFADHGGELGAQVRAGRRQFLAQFPSFVAAAPPLGADDPTQRASFERCKLDLGERQRHAEIYALHRDLIRLRRNDAVLRMLASIRFDGAVLNDDAFVLRYFAEGGVDRLLIVNFGADWQPAIVPEPLLAPPPGMRWATAWSSEDPAYGGNGARACESADGGWFVPGHASVFLSAQHDD